MPDQHGLPEGDDAFAELFVTARNLAERVNAELNDYPTYSAAEDVIQTAEARLPAIRAAAVEEERAKWRRIVFKKIREERAALRREERERSRKVAMDAVMLLPCNCPAHGIASPDQHADECPVGVGGRVLAALDQEGEGESDTSS